MKVVIDEILSKMGQTCLPTPWLSGSGCLCGFFVAFGVGLLLVNDPSVGEVKQLAHRQQVIDAKAVGLFPGILLLVAAVGNDAVPVAPLACVSPDGDLQNADSDSVCWL